MKYEQYWSLNRCLIVIHTGSEMEDKILVRANNWSHTNQSSLEPDRKEEPVGIAYSLHWIPDEWKPPVVQIPNYSARWRCDGSTSHKEKVNKLACSHKLALIGANQFSKCPKDVNCHCVCFIIKSGFFMLSVVKFYVGRCNDKRGDR